MLLLSGGNVASAVSEAVQMAAVCVTAGVPKDCLLLEQESRNTFENVARTVELLRREGLLADLQTVLLVSCPWHMRRVFLSARRGFPAHVRLLCCPHNEGCTEADWQDSAECRELVTAELALLDRFTEAGLLPHLGE
jgi:vancomycin permeability regulator SanA